MRSLLTILFFSFTAIAASAQVSQENLDSARQSIDSIRQQKLSILDSAELKVNKAANKIQQVSNSLTGYDTLGKKTQILQTTLNKKKAQLTSKIDSLKTAGLPFDKYSGKLDSLNRINPSDQLEKVQSRVTEQEGKIGAGKAKFDGVESKIQNLQNAPEGKINEKLNVLSSESKGQGNLPSNVNLPDTKLPETDLNLNKPDLPGIEKPTVNVENPLDKSIDPKLSMPEINKPGELEKVSEVRGKINENVGDVTEKVSGYSEDAKNISKGNIDEVQTLKEDALSKASLDKEMGALKEGEQVISEQKALMETFKNPEAYREKLLSRAKEMTLKQMAARQLKVQEAMTKVSKYQKTAGTILNKKNDLPKRRDPLKKLKFYEKFVPGLTLQVQKPGALLLDINPTLRYRLTSYWSIGSGWNERVIIGTHTRTIDQTKVFGIRTFTEVIIFKGIAMRLDAERMNAFIAPTLQQQDAGTRKWVWNYMAGLKKEFTFMPRIVGNVQFMYNLYDPHHYRMYPTRFNVRFGFEYPLKRRKKKK